jgi:hypothetical protein
MAFLRGAEGQAEAEELVSQIVREEFDTTIQTALEALSFIKTPKRQQKFSEACNNRFTLSTVFKPSAEQAELRLKALDSKGTEGNAEEVIG